MTLPKIIYKIKWKIILVHVLASLLVILSFKQFSAFTDVDLIEKFYKYGPSKTIDIISNQRNLSQTISHFLLWMAIFPLIGMLISFLISLILVRNNKESWINSLLVLVIIFFINRYGVLNSSIVQSIFYSIGNLFGHSNILLSFVINGILLLAIGSFLFFSKWSRKFSFLKPNIKDSVFSIQNPLPSSEIKKINIGNEYDDVLIDKLKIILLNEGGEFVEIINGIGGSQELKIYEVKIKYQVLIIEIETYVGITIKGSKELTDLIMDRLK